MKTHIFGSGTTHFYIGIDNGASAEAEEIYRLASELCGGKEFCFAAFEAENWNDDFSPWQSEPVFGDKGFSGNAKKTLETIEKEVIPFVRESRSTPERQFIAGYSLCQKKFPEENSISVSAIRNRKQKTKQCHALRTLRLRSALNSAFLLIFSREDISRTALLGRQRELLF